MQLLFVKVILISIKDALILIIRAFICGDSIKIFFYFRSNTTECHTHLAADLNNSLMTYDLQTMCDFYMKLIPVKNCTKYDICWVFLSFDVAGDYYVQRHLWT